jgi:hypothetical protein
MLAIVAAVATMAAGQTPKVDPDMNTSTRRKAKRVGTQTTQMMLAAPQVVAQRLTRMALAGARPSPADQREFHRMGAEKVAAFGESWQAMALQMMKVQQTFALSMLRSWWLPGAAARPRSPGVNAWQDAALDVLGKGIAPVRRRAVANAKRLQRPRLR